MTAGDTPEAYLARRDPVLAGVIASTNERWTCQRSEDPIWGLIRIVIAQQISTRAATTLAARVLHAYPSLATDGVLGTTVHPDVLRACGLSPRKADCCMRITNEARRILEGITADEPCDSALQGIPGIGPWTVAIFRIMILRDPDVFPVGDAGLIRAIETNYGQDADVGSLADTWRPFRSVGCWYLWRSLGNPPLG